MHPDEGFLHSVLGIFDAVGKAQGQAEDAALVQHHDLFEGVQVAALGPRQELGFRSLRFRVFVHPCDRVCHANVCHNLIRRGGRKR